MKFRINVDDHDYETKDHVLRFLEEGDKVKATIFFRGREMTRQSLGRQILERLIKDVEQKGLVEFRPRQEGNTLHLILAPSEEGRRSERKAARPSEARAAGAASIARRRADSVGKQLSARGISSSGKSLGAIADGRTRQ